MNSLKRRLPIIGWGGKAIKSSAIAIKTICERLPARQTHRGFQPSEIFAQRVFACLMTQRSELGNLESHLLGRISVKG
jgi:hypothetical protein